MMTKEEQEILVRELLRTFIEGYEETNDVDAYLDAAAKAFVLTFEVMLLAEEVDG